MAGEAEPEVPEGAAVFPEIPPELGVHPLLLAVLHATVFLTGSDPRLVNPAAADEAVERMAGYLRRLRGPQLRPIREDMEVLVRYARQQKWSRQEVRSLQAFLADYGVAEEPEDE